MRARANLFRGLWLLPVVVSLTAVVAVSGVVDPRRPAGLRPLQPRGARSKPVRPLVGPRRAVLRPLRSGSDLVVQVASGWRLPAGLTRKDRTQVNVIIRALKAGRTTAANRAWTGLVTDVAKRKQGTDVTDILLYVLRQSYLEMQEDLRHLAERLRHYNEMKKALREYLAELRKRMADLQDQPRVTVRSIQTPRRFVPTSRPAIVWRRKVVRGDQLKRHIKDLEDDLSTIGDDAQLANIDLQNVLQKQQQLLQTISNVSKMLHDTAMAIIRKIG